MSVGVDSARRAASIARIDTANTVTPSELELVGLFASGYSYEEAAKVKFLSYFTVRNRIKTATTRSGARNPTHLAALCIHQQTIKFNPQTGIFEPVQEQRIIGE